MSENKDQKENKCKYYFKCICNVLVYAFVISLVLYSFSTILKEKGFSALVRSESFLVSFLGILAMYWIYKQTVKEMRMIYKNTEKRNQERKDEELEINKKLVLLKGFMCCFAACNIRNRYESFINEHHPDNLWINLDSLYSNKDNEKNDVNGKEMRKEAEKLLKAWTSIESLEQLRGIDVEARKYYGLNEPPQLNKDYQTEA